MFALFVFTKQLDKEIGTIYTLIISFHSTILISLVYLYTMYLFKISFNVSFYNFTQHCGFSAVCFTLYCFCCFLNKNRNLTFDFLFVPITGQYAPFVVMVIFKLLVPNSSSVCHFVGYFITLWLYKVFSYFIFPRAEWIVDLEKKMNLYKRDTISKFIMYVSVDSNDNVVHNIKEINKFMEFICKKKSIRDVNVNDNVNNEQEHNNNVNNNNSNNEQEMQVITN